MSEQTVFNGRYELHRRLARGGMADVFLARDQLLDRPVAVKVLFPEFATDPSFVERFRREAQSAANLNHPNIVSVYDWGAEQGTYFIVMEYVEGRSLADILRTEGPLHPQRAAEVASDIAAALGFAHRNGVIHRDVKPGNVLISPAGHVKVADFGIARAMGAGVEDNLTKAGSVMGTATYFSPEQAQGLALDPRSDLYSLGVVLYEMVAGRPPFTGDSPVSIAYKHVQEQPTPPRRANANVPADLEAIIMRLLAKNPHARYPSAEDLRADLRRFREGQPVLAAGAATAATAMAAGVTAAHAATQVVPGYEGTRAIPAEELPAAYSEPPRRSGAFLVVLILLLLILAGLLFALAKVLTSNKQTAKESLQVPPGCCVGKPEEQARAALETARFDVTVETQKNDQVEAGIVVSVDPAEGTTVDVEKGKRGQAKLVVSAGATTVKMPKVVGSQVDAAIALLRQQGFTNITTEEAPSDDPNVAKGEVFKQDPPEGADVAKDQLITLTVSSGPPDVQIPTDVKGKDAADAANELGQLGFKTTIQDQPSDTVDAGKVIDTNPPAGSSAPKGSTVTIIRSSGPQKVTIPTVAGLTKQEAEKALSDAGFQPVAGSCSIDPSISKKTQVTSTVPAEGTKANPGTQVTYAYKAQTPADC